ncbi:MAG TPA: hypothetical protein PLS53_03565 [Thermoanaerobaculaceae bacterium]|nr:hypothetical protein [Thermoanaerobaculaceae bacterium]
MERGTLPSAPAEILAKIPLAGANRKSDKFTLGDLVEYREETVARLIEKSVDQHLDRQTYNDTSQVNAALSRCRVDPEPLAAFLPALAALIKRRHNIVHRADGQEQEGSGHHRTSSIGVHHLSEWLNSVERFTAGVLCQLDNSAG